MAAQTELETFQFGQDERHYVQSRVAAKYLHISHDRLQVLIVLGRIETSQFGSRWFIPLDTLKAFDISKYPPRRGR
jgi:hypothetical protein